VLGRGFLGWETRAENLKWLFLQTENGNLRLQADLAASAQRVDDAIKIHTLESDDDGFMRLSNDKVVAGIEALIHETKPDIIVFDPLRDFNIGDLNSDADMATIGRITRKGNPKRIPLIIHHARTGKAGIAKAIGFDRAGFGRNSKVLMAGRARK
jgi:RecA-family ATPase